MTESSGSIARRNRRIAVIFGGLLSAFTLACSQSEGAGAGTGTGTGTGGGDAGAVPGETGDPSVLAGTFQVRLVRPVAATGGNPEMAGSTAVVGKVYDGPTLSQIIWEEAAKEGACRLSTPRVPFCSQSCGGSAACVEDDTCHDYPVARSAGRVKVRGLQTESGEAEFTMAPVVNNYQPPAGVKLRYPAFAPGDEIAFEASGDYFGAFTLKASGISPLVLLNDTITLEPGQPVKLTWTPPDAAGTSTIHVKLDISHHGGTKGMIECDTDDTGSLDLPGPLLTKLTDLGVAGFPTIVVTRSAVGFATIAPGRVDLIVSSDVEHAVEVPGLTSCSDEQDCPGGQTCQDDLTCR